MSKGNTFENDLLKLIFNGTAIANIADNAASAPITTLYVSLHTADPTETGSQNTSECAYTGPYARVAVTRDGTGWVVTADSVSPAAAITFPACTGGTETAGWMGIGTVATGTGKLLYSGAITPTIAISNGITPRLTTGTTITEN